MVSSPITGALSRALTILQNGALLLIATIGTLAAGSISRLVAKTRAGALILMLGVVYAVLGYTLGTLAFPELHDANFEGAIAGGLAGILAGACVGIEGNAFKGVTAGLIGGCLAGVLGGAVAPVSIWALNGIVGGVFGGLSSVAGQLDPGVLGAVFGGALGGFFLTTFRKRLGEVWGEISVGILSGILAFMLILATEITLMGTLSLALRAVTAVIPPP